MIINVDHGEQAPLEGIATRATICVRGDTAKVAVAIPDLIAAPRRKQEVTALEQRWEVLRTLSRTNQLVIFVMRRLDVV